jgi:hypothetical protein
LRCECSAAEERKDPPRFFERSKGSEKIQVKIFSQVRGIENRVVLKARIESFFRPPHMIDLLVGPAATIQMSYSAENSVSLPGVDPPGTNKNTNT